MITYPGYMPDATAKAIDEKVHRVVYLLSHYGSDLDTPSVEVTTSKTTSATETLSAECTSEPAQKAQTLLNNSGQLVTTTEVGWTKCFPADDAYAYLEKNEGDHFRAIIADGAIASNQWVDSDGNAALLINAMAQKPTIYWYDGSKDNVLASDTVDTLEPQWLIPILSLIGIGITVNDWDVWSPKICPLMSLHQRQRRAADVSWQRRSNMLMRRASCASRP